MPNMKKTIIFISLILLVVIGVSAYSNSATKESGQQNNNQPSKDSERKSDKNKNIGELSMPPSVQEICKCQNKKTEPEGNQKHQWYETFFNHPTEWLLVLFNGLLVLFACRLWKATVDLWKVSQDSIKLTKQEFVASHPPKLRVHTVHLIRNPVWEIQCLIDNIGGSVATIEKSTLDFEQLEGEIQRFPSRLPYGEDYPLPERTIAPGGYTVGQYLIEKKVEDSLNEQNWQTDQGLSGFYFFGYIIYLDDNGTRRKIAFCRQYTGISKDIFVKIDNEDYEYS